MANQPASGRSQDDAGQGSLTRARGRTGVSADAVRAELVQRLYQSPLPILANLAVATLCVVVVWGHLPKVWLVGWLFTMLLVAVARVSNWYAFTRRHGHRRHDATLWERRMAVSVAITGTVWGSSGLAIAYGQLPTHIAGVIAIAVCGMVAGSMFALTASTPVFRLYALPTTLGPILGFLAVGDRTNFAIAGMGIVYLLVVLFWGRDTGRRIESEIRLRLENDALVSDLAAVQERADEADRLKRESFANLGHELRTPLNAIIGFAQSLDAELWGPLGSPRYREYARSISDSGQHLYELIQGILDLSRHDAGILELEEGEADLAELARACREMLAGTAAAAGVSLTVDVPATALRVTGDATKLRQVVINLLANAIRYTPSAGTVTIAVSRHDTGETELRVEDTGVGIAAEDIPRAMEPFVQVSRDRTRTGGGAGLGLPLAKRLTELHGGRLELISEPGVGTVVRIILPATRLIAGEGGQAPRR